MKNLLTTLAFTACVAAKTVTLAPFVEVGEPIAIVWIQGALCDNEAYTEIAQAVQAEGALHGQRIWVGIPSFISGAPDPVTISGKVDKTIESLQELGFTGDNIVMAGHSLGGVMAQGYTADHADKIKAQVLMGSVLTRDKRSINDDGTTQFNYDVATMALGGTKDGLMRISRVAESFWHSNININDSQSKNFPTIAFEGVSHAQFLSGEPPLNVRNHDLVPDVTLDIAHQLTAEAMVQFMDQTVLGNSQSLDIASSFNVLRPLLDAMELEGYSETKPPCYCPDDLVCPEDPTCLHGAPWNSNYAQQIMGGELPGTNMQLLNDDNFHDVIHPRLAEVENHCEETSIDCVLKSVTVTQNNYADYDKLDTGAHPQAAFEMKTKIVSRQKIQEYAGRSNVSYHDSDEVGNNCAQINDASIEWAYSQLSDAAKANYDKFGVKLVTGDDKGPYSKGPDWEVALMEYNLSEDGTEMVVLSPYLTTSTSFPVKSIKGVHYCMLISPFKAVEYMMLDGLYTNNGIKNQSASLFLQ